MQLKIPKTWNCKPISVFTHDSVEAQAQFCFLEHRSSTLQEISFFSQLDFQSFLRPHISIFVFCFLDHCHSCFLFLLDFLYLFASFSYLSGSVICSPTIHFPWHIFIPVFHSTSESRL